MFATVTRARAFLLFLALAVSLLPGCSRHSPSQPAAPKAVNLGAVDMSYGTPSRQDLGDGAVCVLTPQTLGPGSIELTAVLERSGKKVASSRSAPVTLDRSLDISFGDVSVALTPHIK